VLKTGSTAEGLAVVIPAFNEAATVTDIASRALKQTDLVIVVDDGSTDDTVKQLTGLLVVLLKHNQNQGKAASLQTGFDYALRQGAKKIITLDADGQHQPEEIPRLLTASEQHPKKIIIAARLKRQESVPKSRLFANRFANFWISWAAGYRISDSQSGFRLYPAALLKKIRLNVSRNRGFVFESEILIEAARAGYRSYPVEIHAIYHPDRRASHYRPVSDTAKIVRMVAGKLFSRGMYPQGLLAMLKDK